LRLTEEVAKQVSSTPITSLEKIKGRIPFQIILSCLSQLTLQELDKDLKAAGLPKKVPGRGKVDFHALRNCFITRLIEAGGNVKEVQELARQSDPRFAMGIYAKADPFW
jgi:site-specific recombinase XerD